MLSTSINNTIPCNCRTPPTQTTSSSYDISRILLLLSVLFLISVLVVFIIRKEKETKWEKTSEDPPPYTSEDPPPYTSNYTEPQHDNFLPASNWDITPVPPAITGYVRGFSSPEDRSRQIAEMKAESAEDKKKLEEVRCMLDVVIREQNELRQLCGLLPMQLTSLSQSSSSEFLSRV
jgi:hypothetical protein